MLKASSSGEPTASMTGCSSGIASASTSAPKMPPTAAATNPAPKARPASPRRAIWWPSMTVAAAPTVPGTPNSTAGIKSDVVVTAATPSSSANEVGASRL